MVGLVVLPSGPSHLMTAWRIHKVTTNMMPHIFNLCCRYSLIFCIHTCSNYILLTPNVLSLSKHFATPCYSLIASKSMQTQSWYKSCLAHSFCSIVLLDFLFMIISILLQWKVYNWKDTVDNRPYIGILMILLGQLYTHLLNLILWSWYFCAYNIQQFSYI